MCKKIFVLPLIFIFCLNVLIGCTGRQNTGDPAAGTQESVQDAQSGGSGTSEEYEYAYQKFANTPTTIDVWCASFWFGREAYTNGWSDHPVHREITKKTGVSLNLEVPIGSEEELAGPLIASGDFPEVMIFSSYTVPYIGQMRDGNQIYNFNELMDQYAPEMYKVMDEGVEGEYQWLYHADDKGVLWAYVSFVNTLETLKTYGGGNMPGTHEHNVMYVRKDTLEAFGQDDITTLDDYTAYLHFVKDNFPELDPVQVFASRPMRDVRLIRPYLQGTFGMHLSDTYPQADGSVKHYIYDPAYVEILSWLNKLYRDGVITSDMLTYDAATRESKAYSAGYASIMEASYNIFGGIQAAIEELYPGDDSKQYTSVGPIEKPGVKWMAAPGLSKGGQATVISKKTKQAERIICFLEYMLSPEGQMLVNCGVEGYTYDLVNGEVSFRDEVKQAAVTSLEEYSSKYLIGGPWSFWMNATLWEKYLGGLITPAGDIASVTNNKRLSSIYYDLWNDGFAEITTCIPTGSELDVLKTKVEDACDIASVKMVAAPDDAAFQGIYDACLKEVEGYGVALLEEAYTAEHKAQLERMKK